MKTNLAKEERFLKIIQEGLLTVTSSGRCVNNVTGREIGFFASGYKSIGWNFGNGTEIQLVHRLVYRLFGTDPLTDEWPLVNHKDGDKTNNLISNLERSNHPHNIAHARSSGLWVRTKNMNAAARNRRKITADMIKTAYDLRVSGVSVRKIAGKFGVSYYPMYAALTQYAVGEHWSQKECVLS